MRTGLHRLRRPPQNRNDFLRPGDAGAGHPARRRSDRGERSVPCHRLLAGRLAGGRLSVTRQARTAHDLSFSIASRPTSTISSDVVIRADIGTVLEPSSLFEGAAGHMPSVFKSGCCRRFSQEIGKRCGKINLCLCRRCARCYPRHQRFAKALGRGAKKSGGVRPHGGGCNWAQRARNKFRARMPRHRAIWLAMHSKRHRDFRGHQMVRCRGRDLASSSLITGWRTCSSCHVPPSGRISRPPMKVPESSARRCNGPKGFRPFVFCPWTS